MSTTLTRWRESAFAPFEWAGLLPALVQAIRVEKYIDDGRCIVRAELPGFDPGKDIEVSVLDGVLTIKAQRTEAKREKLHSEFHYGRFERSVALPDGAVEETAMARYVHGVLEITLALGEVRASGRRIPIQTAEHPTNYPPVARPAVVRPDAARPSSVGSSSVPAAARSTAVRSTAVRSTVARPAAKTSTVRHRRAAS